jgi:hypothetical protein
MARWFIGTSLLSLALAFAAPSMASANDGGHRGAQSHAGPRAGGHKHGGKKHGKKKHHRRHGQRGTRGGRGRSR